MTASEGGPPWGMRGQAAWKGPSAKGPFSFPRSLTSSVGRMEGSLLTASIARPLGWQGLGSFRKGRGPGTCQNPFLRASSFCLRADEVGLIMTNLEKANQVRRLCRGSLAQGGGSPGLGGGEGAEFSQDSLNYNPVLSTGARTCQKDPAPAFPDSQNTQKWGDAGSSG